MATFVTGGQYHDLDGQLLEIKFQLRQPNGYPFDLEALKRHLQLAIEGKTTLAVNEVLEEVLEFRGKVMVEIDQTLNTDDFLQTREGLWVHSDLELLGGKACPLVETVELSKYSLRKNTLDSAITRELPENFIFTIEECRTIIASLLNKQWGGKEGILPNDGCAKIFYVWDKDKKLCFAVSVGWDSDSDRWLVDVWSAGRRWDAEDTVFSRN